MDFIYAAHQENPELNLELFVHKAEKMQEEDKIGAYVVSFFLRFTYHLH